MMSNRYSADMKTAELFQEIEKRINENPKPVEGIESVYQFELSGDDGATYQLHLSNGTAKVVEGPAASADCTLQMDAKDFKDMVFGNLNGTAAFMTGKLKIKGDMSKAIKLQSILSKYEV
jgi:putative sterol carrier protein